MLKKKVDQLPVTQKAVNHDVPDQENFLGRDAFVFQIVDAALLGDEKQAGNRIGQLAIDFLWHSHVEAAQSGLDVRHFNAQLHRCKSCRDGGIHVAHNEYHLRLVVEQNRLKSFHDFAGLDRVAARTDL